MRTPFLLLTLLPTAIIAQCTFTPTVTPSDLILCPQETGTLSTQEYDAYQWYKEGEPIEGATGQTLEVEQFADAGSSFTVEVTDGGCTEMSAPVLVDGWMFLLPAVMHGGDEPYAIGGEGESFFCVGDTMTLTMMQPYVTNITWYRNGEIMQDQNGVTLEITTSGAYTASGAPEVCPNYIGHVGVDVMVAFSEPMQATLVYEDGQLCAQPEGESYTWYLNGAELIDVELGCISALEAGSYTVLVDYDEPCQAISEPFLITGVADRAAPAFNVAPNPSNGQTRITWPADLRPQGQWNLVDVTGRSVLTGSFNGAASLQLDLGGVADGGYIFQAIGAVPLRIVVKR